MAMAENLLLDAGNLRQATGYILGALSGDMTLIAADADVFAFRNVSTSPIVLSKLTLGWVTKTAFGTAQALGFRAHKAYGFTAVHDTGSPKSIQAHYKRQSQIRGSSTGDRVALTDLSAVISGAAAMTNGVYTAPDADEPEFFAAVAGNLAPAFVLSTQPHDWLPLVLEQDEGIVVKNQVLMGATGVGSLFVGMELFRSTPQ
jgi:hypothetical protein